MRLYNISIVIVFFIYSITLQAQSAAQLSTLGNNYYEGINGYSKDHALAFNYFTSAAKKGDVQACFILSEMYYYGNYVERNQELSYKYYEKAAKKGHSLAQCYMAWDYIYGVNVGKNLKEAKKWIDKSMAKGEKRAYSYLGEYYLQRDSNNVENENMAVFTWKKGIENGDGRSAYKLSLLYYNGSKFTKKDIDKFIEYLTKGAELNSVSSLSLLALCYYEGIIVKKDIDKAYSLVKRTEDMNCCNDLSNYLLGLYYYYGDGEVDKNLKKAFGYFYSSAMAGNCMSMLYLGLSYMNGYGVETNITEGLTWLRKSADNDYAAAYYWLGDAYIRGIGIDKNIEEGICMFEKAAQLGDFRGYKDLGYYYFMGENLNKDYKESVKWLKKDYANNPYPDGQTEFLMGICYYNGIGIEKDQKKAFQMFSDAEKLDIICIGDYNLYNYLGICYWKGKGMKKNIDEAIWYFEKGTKLNDSYCFSNLGEIYLNEKKDVNKALEHYIKAASLNNVNVQNMLGGWYYYGKYVKKDDKKAYEWFLKGAENGYNFAQRNLGISYESGIGIKQDKNEALRWYRISADNGLDQAKEDVARLEKELGLDKKTVEKKLANIEWFEFYDSINSSDFDLQIGVKSDSRIEAVEILLNGQKMRGQNVVNADLFDMSINRTFHLTEGINTILVKVTNAAGMAIFSKNVVYVVPQEKPRFSNKRLALVIGNSQYKDASLTLKNPGNDANDIADKLQLLGFDVIRAFDSTKGAMDEALREFYERSINYDISLFFYAGHGLSNKGINFLVPTDADLPSEQFLSTRCIDANQIMKNLEEFGCPLRVMILDACRDNPFSRRWRRNRSTESPGGLTEIKTRMRGTFIAFSTGLGDTASDGGPDDHNSPYTSALLHALDIPNLTLNQVFSLAHRSVNDKVPSQLPWINSSYYDDVFIFNPQ